MQHYGFKDYPLPLAKPETGKQAFSLHQEFKAAVRKDPCAYCGRKGGTIDHIVPVKPASKGKSKRVGPSNWTGACTTCNKKKQTRKLLQFLDGQADGWRRH